MIDLYDLSIKNYERVLDASVGFLKKSENHFTKNDQDMDEIISMQLASDMYPFTFQVNSIRHHSLHAAQGILEGQFTPPEPLPEMEFSGLVNLLEVARKELDEIDAEQLNACSGKPVIFKMGSMELPFTAENFVLSFSLPNLYFHCATAYDMLRIKGVPLGKVDFLGNVNIGLAS